MEQDAFNHSTQDTSTDQAMIHVAHSAEHDESTAEYLAERLFPNLRPGARGKKAPQWNIQRWVRELERACRDESSLRYLHGIIVLKRRVLPSPHEKAAFTKQLLALLSESLYQFSAEPIIISRFGSRFPQLAAYVAEIEVAVDEGIMASWDVGCQDHERG